MANSVLTECFEGLTETEREALLGLLRKIEGRPEGDSGL